MVFNLYWKETSVGTTRKWVKHLKHKSVKGVERREERSVGRRKLPPKNARNRQRT
jgi:hypothetical protein